VADAVSRRALLGGSLAAVAAAVLGCTGEPEASPPPTGTPAATATSNGPSGAAPSPAATPPRPRRPVATGPVATDPAGVGARATVPVLCWHQLRDWTGGDSPYDRRLLICPPRNFRAQLDALAAAGWTTIDPDRYLDHLTTGARLPPRPVLLTFDDSQGSQISVGLPELTRRRMTATFFVMTVALDKPGWMRRTDLLRLDRAGMTVAAHTWDHHPADRYSGADWRVQLLQPRAELERLVHKPVRHFAYPYGAWSPADFPHLTQAGYLSAYQLSGRKPDPGHPLLTLRRILVDSSWTGPQLLRRLAAWGHGG
jgi:peptidoglycan/xylan/chitin deacetylase (PgdA/CDA1 family)